MTHTIKVNYTDGNKITTQINGTADEISDFYGSNNVMAYAANEPQAKRIEYIESPLLDNSSTYVYLFADWDNNGLLQ
jgi:hypothetical protein